MDELKLLTRCILIAFVTAGFVLHVYGELQNYHEPTQEKPQEILEAYNIFKAEMDAKQVSTEKNTKQKDAQSKVGELQKDNEPSQAKLDEILEAYNRFKAEMDAIQASAEKKPTRNDAQCKVEELNKDNEPSQKKKAEYAEVVAKYKIFMAEMEARKTSTERSTTQAIEVDPTFGEYLPDYADPSDEEIAKLAEKFKKDNTVNLTQIIMREKRFAPKAPDNVQGQLNQYNLFKLIELESKIDILSAKIDDNLNIMRYMIIKLDQHLNFTMDKLSENRVGKLKEDKNKCTKAPVKPQITVDREHYALVEINHTATAYNQLVKKKDHVNVSVMWTRDLNKSCSKDISKVILNGDVVWSGEGNNTTATLKIKKGGRYEIKIVICNNNGCSSDAANIIVADTDGSHLIPPEYNMGKTKNFKQTSGKVVGAYFVEWGVYRRAFTVDRVPVPNLTHLMYSFIPMCGGDGINDSMKKTKGRFESLQQICSNRVDFSVAIADPKAALLMTHSGLNSTGNPYKGNFGQLMMLKPMRPELKVIASIGGATMGDPFYFFTNTTRRNTFVASVKDFLQTWKFFDGVDIDWEYPGGKGTNRNLGSLEDGNIYVQLMKELHEMLKNLSAETSKNYELTSAISADWRKMMIVDYKEAQKYVDHFFLMTYNFKGAWSNDNLGHHTGLYSPEWKPSEYQTANYATKLLMTQGVKSEKIVLGVAMFGRGWTGVHNYSRYPFTGKANGPVEGTWQNGVVEYKDIVKRISEGKWMHYYDSVAEAPYVFNNETGDLVTYDSMRSTIAKGNYVRDNKLGGLFAWELSNDNGDILGAMNMGLMNKLDG